MGLKNQRTKATATKGQHKSSGTINVTYRDAQGRSFSALVLSEGTSSGLKLAITADGNRVVDNVPLATTLKSANSYFSREV